MGCLYVSGIDENIYANNKVIYLIDLSYVGVLESNLEGGLRLVC